MSDYSISIVPKRSTFPGKEARAKEILDWLISLDIVKPDLSDCILSDKNGYAISDGAKNIVDDIDILPFDLTINGLDVVTERQVFDTGVNGMEKLICPNCKQDISVSSCLFQLLGLDPSLSQHISNKNQEVQEARVGQSTQYILPEPQGF